MEKVEDNFYFDRSQKGFLCLELLFQLAVYLLFLKFSTHWL